MNTSSLGIKTSLYHFVQNRMREIIGGFFLLIAAFLILSLLSYYSSDPSYNMVGQGPYQNWLGSAGASSADFLLQTIGLASIFVILTLLSWSWRQFFTWGESHWILRISTLTLALCAAAFLFALLPFPSVWPISSGLGGSIGSIMASYLPNGLLTFLGSIIMFASFCVLWAVASGLNRKEWKAIGRVTFITLRTIAVILRKLFSIGRPATLPSKKLAWRKYIPFLPDVEDEEDFAPAPKSKRRPRVTKAADNDEADNRAEPKISPRVQKTAKKESQTSLALTRRNGAYELPDISLLKKAPKSLKKHSQSDAALEQNARLLESVLHDFGIKGEIIGIRPGPVVTLYELEPAAGTKSSRVIGLSDDIARSMSAISARISVIPGRNAMGIELPNSKRETVYLRDMIEGDEFTQTESNLPLALGKDIGGESIVVDLAKMPHLLVAGTTGSGKSVAINTMITSLLYHHTPDECKFIMIDPKMLELSVYDGIPHLLCPVVTEPPKAVVALKWVTKEMENRYRLMANLGVRNIAGYNKRLRSAKAKGEELKRTVQTGFDPESGKPIYEDQPMDMNDLPFIVVIVDEMADLMLVAGKDIETSVQRLAQMARAAGIHIIMATQRPSVDVITGVVKANFPTRISFQVTSRIDSRTILGDQGAEQLLGMGDMLYMEGGGKMTRVHGPFVSDKEVEELVAFIKTQGEPDYVEEVTIDPEESGDLLGGLDEMDEETQLYHQAVAIVKGDNKASTSYIQRKLKIGYNRAARLIDRMEEEGIISPANHVGKREIL